MNAYRQHEEWKPARQARRDTRQYVALEPAKERAGGTKCATAPPPTPFSAVTQQAFHPPQQK